MDVGTRDRVLILLLVALLWGPGLDPREIAAQSVHYEGGITLATGDYFFTERTTSWSIANGLAVAAGPLSFRATIPIYVQNTQLLTGSTTGPLPTGGGPASGAVGDSSRSRRGDGRGDGPGMVGGLASGQAAAMSAARGPNVEVPSSAVPGFAAAVGDPTVDVGLTLWQGRRTSVSASLGAKIPATDTTEFGTGEWDVGAAVSIAHAPSLSTLLGFDVSYWHLGDLPELNLQDPVAVSGSVSYLSRKGWGVSAFLSGSRSIVAGFEDSFVVGAGATRLGSSATLGVTASVGLTETAADLAIGVNWRVKLGS